MRRRHLNESQRALAAARLATLNLGGQPCLGGVCSETHAAQEDVEAPIGASSFTIAQAARLFKVNVPSILQNGILSHGLVESQKIPFTPIYLPRERGLDRKYLSNEFLLKDA